MGQGGWGMGDRATVAIERVETYDRAVLGPAIERAVEAAGGWRSGIKSGDRVLVKPNCISGVPRERAAQTDPAVILEVCRQLIDFGARPFVGDSPAWGSLEGNLRVLGALDELRRMDVPVVPFTHPRRAENPRGMVFHYLTVDAAALEADAIVNLPKFKAHRQLKLTVVLKNMFGCVSGRRKALWHFRAGSYENYFGRMLIETFEMLRPVMNIVDAVTAMEGKGPISGTPRQMNLIMASTDGPATERITVDLVGLAPDKLRTLAAARELGIGTPHRDRIDVIGADVASVAVEDFEIPPQIRIGFSFPRLVRGAFKNAWITHQQHVEGQRAAS